MKYLILVASLFHYAQADEPKVEQYLYVELIRPVDFAGKKVVELRFPKVTSPLERSMGVFTETAPHDVCKAFGLDVVNSWSEPSSYKAMNHAVLQNNGTFKIVETGAAKYSIGTLYCEINPSVKKISTPFLTIISTYNDAIVEFAKENNYEFENVNILPSHPGPVYR